MSLGENLGNICHYAQEGLQPQLRLNSDTLSLKASQGWYHGQACVEAFENVVFMRGDQPFGSRARHGISGNVCSGYVNMSTGRMINGGVFSLWRSPGVASKAIIGAFSFRVNLRLAFLHDTSVKEMHTKLDDNARTHKGRIVDASLEQETIQHMPWTA
ncbi:hypothetical protein TNCV_3398721 [Trichonephila clavipes]|nr:hypothetical protein TNCV_3398721 [Trichonephila clavipes]